MERLNDLELPWYIKDDVIDLVEDYPNLFEMSAQELQKLFQEKYSDAKYHTERAAKLENDANAIEQYCMAKYGEEIMLEDIKKFLGQEPYNTETNVVKGDAIYLNWLYKKYGEEVVKAKVKELENI